MTTPKQPHTSRRLLSLQLDAQLILMDKVADLVLSLAAAPAPYGICPIFTFPQTPAGQLNPANNSHLVAFNWQRSVLKAGDHSPKDVEGSVNVEGKRRSARLRNL